MVDVTIYTRVMCGYCATVKQLLDRKGVAYTEYDASFSPQLRQEMMVRSGGRYTLPQIFVGDLHLGGADDVQALEKEGRLDEVLRTGRL